MKELIILAVGLVVFTLLALLSAWRGAVGRAQWAEKRREDDIRERASNKTQLLSLIVRLSHKVLSNPSLTVAIVDGSIIVYKDRDEVECFGDDHEGLLSFYVFLKSMENKDA